VIPPVFYLGAHHPNWLWNGSVTCPLFVSHARLRERRTPFPAATVSGWALDSMGFTMLRDYGMWTISPREYVEAVIRYDSQIKRLEWAAPQDWMCEDAIISGGVFGGQKFRGTGLTVEEHQRRTVANFPELTAIWRELSDQESPFMPVLQGEPGNVASYLRCAQMYEDAGVRLAGYPVVGVGSVCRIQDRPVIGRLARGLAHLDLPLHWFGLKLTGLPEVWPHITSHDSLAWSYDARRSPRMAGCTHVCTRGPNTGRPSNCANCPRFAQRWRDQVAALGASLPGRGYQAGLFGDEFPGVAA
jgi:hypothetical protein